jgi:imidazolonepropionase-like amidohydrolase
LQAATIIPAIILKMESDIGQIKEGFYADIIAVADNPEENIGTLEQMQFVMKGGVVYIHKQPSN